MWFVLYWYQILIYLGIQIYWYHLIFIIFIINLWNFIDFGRLFQLFFHIILFVFKHLIWCLCIILIIVFLMGLYVLLLIFHFLICQLYLEVLYKCFIRLQNFGLLMLQQCLFCIHFNFTWNFGFIDWFILQDFQNDASTLVLHMYFFCQ